MLVLRRPSQRELCRRRPQPLRDLAQLLHFSDPRLTLGRRQLIGAILDERDGRIFGVARVGGNLARVVFAREEGAGERREDCRSVFVFLEQWL